MGLRNGKSNNVKQFAHFFQQPREDVEMIHKRSKVQKKKERAYPWIEIISLRGNFPLFATSKDIIAAYSLMS